jgi:hypothetical protein
MAFYLSLYKGPRSLLADFPSLKISMMGMLWMPYCQGATIRQGLPRAYLAVGSLMPGFWWRSGPA